MADIAFIFHWPLDQLDAMSMDELLDWQRRALERWNKVHGNGKDG